MSSSGQTFHTYNPNFCLIFRGDDGEDDFRRFNPERPIIYSACSEQEAIQKARFFGEGIARDNSAKYGQEVRVLIEITGSQGLVELTEQERVVSVNQR